MGRLVPRWRGCAVSSIALCLVPVLTIAYACVTAKGASMSLPAVSFGWLAACALVVYAAGVRWRDDRSAVVGLSVVIVLWVVVLSLPAAYRCLDGMAGVVSRIGALLLRMPLSLGPTALGLPVFALSLCLTLAGRGTDARTKLLVVIYHFVWLLAVACLAGIAIGMAVRYGSRRLYWPSLSLLVTWVRFCPYALPALGCCLIHLRMGRRASATLGYGMTVVSMAAILAVGVLTWLWLPSPPATEGSAAILIFDDNHLDFGKPDATHYTASNTGMFGRLPGYLRDIGYTVRRGPITRTGVDGSALVIIINPRRYFTDDEERLIWRFVRSGGSLLVLGDHTGDLIVRRPLNRLLSRAGISYGFDTAEPLSFGWTGSLCFSRHPLAGILRGDPAETSIWVGASLRAAPPARPVVVGRYGFSDRGDSKNRDGGNLGNREYDPGERYGDLVLVAEAPYGNGKVIAFGDTSSLQNSSLAFDDRFVRGLMEYLTRTKSRPVRNCAAIDGSHWGCVSADEWAEDGTGGLCNVLSRSGYNPRIAWRWSEACAAECGLLVIVEPRLPFGPSEIQDVERFAQRGGTVVLAAGRGHGEAPERLMSEIGIRVRGEPLGRVRTRCRYPGYAGLVDFACAWELDASPAWATLCSAWGKPAVVTRQVGAGRLTVIGDSLFLLNHNMEGLHDYSSNNTKFVQFLTKESPQ